MNIGADSVRRCLARQRIVDIVAKQCDKSIAFSRVFADFGAELVQERRQLSLAERRWQQCSRLL